MHQEKDEAVVVEEEVRIKAKIYLNKHKQCQQNLIYFCLFFPG
jgi:hypothetical protein